MEAYKIVYHILGMLSDTSLELELIEHIPRVPLQYHPCYGHAWDLCSLKFSLLLLMNFFVPFWDPWSQMTLILCKKYAVEQL